jgi:hypothetical protein
MNISPRLAIFAVVVLLASCANRAVNDANAIEPGASKQEVTNQLGPPQNRQFNARQEAWQYCQTEFVNDSFVVVWFLDGRVTGVNTYRDSINDIGFCSSHFKSVNWEEAPDAAIEIRHR